MRVRPRQWLPVIAVVLLATAVARAQSGSGSNPVSGSAQVLDVAGGKIRVVTMATGLFHPWSLAFLPDGRLLVAERNGKLRILGKDGVLSPEIVWTSPTPPGQGADALHGLAVHPKFAENKLVYMSYPKNGPKGNTLAVSRGRLEGDKLTELAEIFVADAWETSGNLAGHMMFGPDSTLYVMVGDRDRLCCTGSEDNSLRMKAQALDNHVGKTLRLKDDGGVPADNPFVGRAGALPEIWSLGHRNVQGAAIHPATGELWESEHGPQGGDEINVIDAGKNYGWPLVTFGRNYVTGTRIGEEGPKPGFEQPLKYWVPTSIAPSGMAFLTSDRYPGWQGSLFIGALRGEALVRLTIDGRKVVGEQRLLEDLKERIRDVRQGPDGWLYVVTDSPTGRVLRLER